MTGPNGARGLLLKATLALATVIAVPVAAAFNSGDIVVNGAQGEVRMRHNGAERNLRRGNLVQVPSSVRTGRDSSAELQQGATIVTMGPETLLDFPASQARGEPVERIVQDRGNAFYDVGKREPGKRLRVETPYLVAVIKGTQFSVTVQEDSTSISLVEGSLEILTPDTGTVVDIVAGEIAMRRRGETGITVVDIDAPQARAPAAGGAAATVADARQGNGAAAVVAVGNAAAGAGATVTRTSVAGNAGAELGRDRADVNVGAAPTLTADGVSVDARLEVDPGRNVGLDARAVTELATGALTTDVDVGTNLGAIGADVSIGAGAVIDAGSVEASVDTSSAVSVGAADVGVGVDASVGIGADSIAAVDVGVTTDVAGVGADVGASIDVGADTVDLGAGADVGGADVDVDVGAGVDAGAGAVDLGVGADVGGIEAGVDVGADLGSGTIDAGLDVGGVELDVGLDLGLDAGDAAPDTGGTAPVDVVTDTVGDVVQGVGGLLGGLLGRP